jgi:SAM-dependent methyltransferase
MAAALASTPQPIVDVMLLIAHQYGRLTEDDVLLDPGCGDGRFLIKAVKRFGCKAIGVEIDPKTADLAEAAIKEAGVGKQVLVVRGDATKHQLGIATAVTLYLFPDTIRAVMSKLDKENVRVVVSHQHPIPGVTNRSMEFSVDGETHTIFFWSREE